MVSDGFREHFFFAMKRGDGPRKSLRQAGAPCRHRRCGGTAIRRHAGDGLT